MRQLNISGEGYALIEKWEGFKQNAYLDPVGIWTIGFGTTRYADGRRVRKGDTMSLAEARFLMQLQAQKFMDEIASAKLIRVPLSQGRIDAIASFVYNLGMSAFARSTLLKKINQEDWVGAGNEFVRNENGQWKGWIYAGGKQHRGLIDRRLDEKALFLRG